MGLDIVELVMIVEEEFDIDIPDKDQEKILTVGELSDFVVGELTRLGRPVNPDVIFETVRNIAAERAEVEPERVTRDSRFIDDLGLD